MKKTGVVCLILALILNLWAPVTVTASDVEESLKVYVSDGRTGSGRWNYIQPVSEYPNGFEADSVRADTGAFGNGKIYPL